LIHFYKRFKMASPADTTTCEVEDSGESTGEAMQAMESVEDVARELKEVEQEMIARELEATEKKIEALEGIETSQDNPLNGDLTLSPEALAARGIHVTNVMEFTATLELSAPKDLAKMYNFSGLKSNLPRDDINLQFCRGQLKLMKDMLTQMMSQSKRKKSLLDPQTLLLLKSQEESHLVAEKTDFWRRAALLHLKVQKPQSEKNPEWLAEYKKDGLDVHQKEIEKFWKEVETGKVSSQRKKSTSTYIAPVCGSSVQTGNKCKRKQLEQKWQVSCSDDTWYRAPQFHPQGISPRRTDIEVLCDVIYEHGQSFEDGTAVIGLTWLLKVLNKANTIGVLLKAKKYGLVYFNGEIVFASVRSEDDDEFVVLQTDIHKIRKAFSDMRARHADFFEFENQTSSTTEEDCDEGDDETLEETDESYL